MAELERFQFTPFYFKWGCRGAHKEQGHSEVFVSITPCCLLLGIEASSLPHMLKRRLDGLFLFTHHKPDLGICFYAALPQKCWWHSWLKMWSGWIKITADPVFCHLAQTLRRSLPDAPSSAAIVSLTAPGRESHGPSEFPTPCPVLTSGIAITIWNVTHVFRVLCLWIRGSFRARTTSSRICV